MASVIEGEGARAEPQSPPQRRQYSLRFWLSAVVIACTLPAFVVAAGLIDHAYDQQRARIQSGALVTARTLAQALDGEIGGIVSALRILSLARSLAAEDFATFDELARRALPQYPGASILLIDKAGRAPINTAAPVGAMLPRIENLFDPDALESDRPTVTDVRIGPVSGRQGIVVRLPVESGRGTRYFLAMSLPLDRLDPFMRRQSAPPGHTFTIFDRRGVIIARSRSPEQYVGKPGTADFLAELARTPEGVLEFPTLEGDATFVGFTRSALTGWSVVVAASAASLTEDIRRAVWISVAAAAMVLLFGAAVAQRISSGIVRSVRALETSATAAAAGPSPRRYATRELAQVGAALDQMATLRRDQQAEHERAEVAAQEATIARQVAVRLRALLESTPDAVIVFDRTGRIRFASGAARTVLGVDADLDQLSIEAVIPGLDADAVARASTAGAAGLELAARRPDGSSLPVEVRVGGLELDGELLTIAAVRDVSERRRMAAEVESSRAKMVAAMRLSALGTMAGGIAHEINNPLAVIHATASDLAEIAAEGDVPAAEIADSAEAIRAYATRITRIVTSLRHLARDGTADPVEPASVAAIVGDALNVGRERFRHHDVALEVPAIDPGLTLRCRAVQVSQVLMNLLQNAYDAVADGPGEKWVRLEVAVTGAGVAFSVTDSGPGVPAAIRSRIMDPFFTTKPVDKGTGLGLSLSREIAEAHGGSLTLDETADGHTRFRLVIPADLELRDDRG